MTLRGSLFLVVAWLMFSAVAEAAEERQVLSEDALWRAAGAAFQDGQDKSAAMQQYRLFVNTYNKSEHAAQAQFMLAECYFAIGDYETARKEFARVKDFKGRTDYLDASVRLRIGECWFNVGDMDAAIATYTGLIDKYEDSFLLSEALYEVGLAYIVDGNWLKLKAAYRRLLDARPGYGEMAQVKFALGLFAYHDERYDEAIAYFEQVPSDRGLYYLGRCLEDTGQYILAIQRYKQVQRQFPDSPLGDDVAFSVAEAFYRSGQNAVAVRSYQEFIESFPESDFVPNARYKMACVTYQEGRYDESIRELQEICKLFKGTIVCAYAAYLTGDCYMHLGRTADAIFAYTGVVKDFEDSTVASAALHKIVYAYAEDENWGQSIQMAKEFERRYAGDRLEARVSVLRGFAHYRLEEYDAAILSFQNVLDKNVNTDVAERALFLATLAHKEQGDYDRLITNYNFIASRLLPTPSVWRARTYYHLGEAYYTEGLYREASGMYRLVLTGYPKSNVAASSLQGLVASLSQMDEYELALQEQEKFLLELANADSEEGTNSLAVGSIYFNQHKYEESLREFLDFIEAHPDAPEAAAALYKAGDAYYRLQYYEQALQMWSRLVSRFPDAPEVGDATYRIADTQFGLGQYADANATYGSLQAAYPNSSHAADAAFGVANCAYNLGQDDRAIAAFTQFVERYPDDPRVEDAELGIQSSYYRSGRNMEEYLSKRPDSALAADVVWNQGQDAFAAGEFKAAAKAFERVTLDYPGSESGAGALFYLAESYYRLEEWEPARAGFRNFLTTHGGHEFVELAMFRTATVEFKLEEFASAAATYETLLDEYPTGEYAPLAAYNRSVAFQQVEDWTAAIGALVQLLDDYPDNERSAGAWLEVAALYQDELGDYAKAVDAYGKALAQGAGSAVEIHYYQGQCHEKAKDWANALAAYQASASAANGGADPFAVASLVQIGTIHEDRHEWSEAVGAYEQILSAGGKPEWNAMAQERIDAIRGGLDVGR